MLYFIIFLVIIFLIIIPLAKKSARENTKAEYQILSERSYTKAKAESDIYRTTLIEQFTSSPLTKEILDVISGEACQKPEEITVYHDKVTGRTDGQVRTYDFLSHRIPNMTSECFSYKEYPDTSNDVLSSQYIYVYAQQAFADALCILLKDDYEISDQKGGWIVVMTLKPTRNF